MEYKVLDDYSEVIASQSSKGPSLWEIMLEGIVILMVPLTVVTFFMIAWWAAFIPLGFLAVAALSAILFRMRRLARKVEIPERTMDI